MLNIIDKVSFGRRETAVMALRLVLTTRSRDWSKTEMWFISLSRSSTACNPSFSSERLPHSTVWNRFRMPCHCSSQVQVGSKVKEWLPRAAFDLVERKSGIPVSSVVDWRELECRTYNALPVSMYVESLVGRHSLSRCRVSYGRKHGGSVEIEAQMTIFR